MPVRLSGNQSSSALISVATRRSRRFAHVERASFRRNRRATKRACAAISSRTRKRTCPITAQHAGPQEMYLARRDSYRPRARRRSLRAGARRHRVSCIDLAVETMCMRYRRSPSVRWPARRDRESTSAMQDARMARGLAPMRAWATQPESSGPGGPSSSMDPCAFALWPDRECAANATHIDSSVHPWE